MARKLEVQIVGDASSLERALKSASSSVGSFGSGVARAGKVAAFALGGAALGGLALTLRAGAREWADSAKVAAQTAAVIKSTGGVANVTGKHVDALSNSLLRQSGIDDEVIKSGENMLLTFTNVRNEVGKGNNIFDRATQVVTDMDVAMHHGSSTQESMSKTAILVGKALNDPIKGIGALSRVGVTFTQQQKDQIKALVESGHAMEAQKIIVGELTREFGGSAKALGDTMPGQINKLKESFDNLAGDLFKSLVPALQRVLDWTNAHWPEIEATFRAVFTALGVLINQVALPALRTLISAGESVVSWVRANWPQISAIATQVFNTVRNVITTTVNIVQAIWSRFGSIIMSEARAAWTYIQSTVQNALNVIRGIINVFAGLLQGDWSRVWTGLRQIFSGVVNQIIAVARMFGTTIVNELRAAWELLKAQAAVALRAASAIGSSILRGIQSGVDKIAGIVSGALQRVWGTIMSFGSALYQAALNAGAAIIHGIGDGIQSALGYVLGKLNDAKNAIKHVVTLGFGSTPYEWGAYAVGGPLMKGIAAGILASMGEATNATEKAKNEIKARMQAADIVQAMQAAGRVIGLEHARGIVMGLLQGTPGIVAQARAALNQAVAAARQAVIDSRGTLVSAFADMAQQALAAFDQKVAAWVPPAQRILDQMQQQDQLTSAQRAVDDATKGLDAARDALAAAVPSEGESEQEFAARVQQLQDAVVSAERQLGDAKRQQTETNLQLEAQQQTIAHNQRMARDRENLAAELAQQQRLLAAHPEMWRQVQANIIAILHKYDVPFFQAGQRLASQFGAGLRKGIAEVAAAARALAAALDQVAGGGPGRTATRPPASSGGPSRPPDVGGVSFRAAGVGGSVFLDGRKVGEWIQSDLARRSGRNATLGIS